MKEKVFAKDNKAPVIVYKSNGDIVQGKFVEYTFGDKGTINLILRGEDGKRIKININEIDGAYLGVPTKENEDGRTEETDSN